MPTTEAGKPGGERSRFLQLRVRAWGVLQAATVVAIGASLAGFLARHAWRFEQLCHYRPQYFVCLAAAAFLFALGRRYRSAGAAGAFAAVNLALILPLYVSGAPPASGGPRLRILLANVHTSNTQHGKMIAYVQRCNPDVVVFEEVDERWVEALKPLRAAYPHGQTEDQEDNFGIALWSRLPLEESSVQYFGEAWLPSIVARLKLDRLPVTLVATHPLPPMSGENVRLRNGQLSAVAEYVSSQSGAKVVVGDLNTTSWSPCFAQLENGTGLRDSRKGFGLQPTWPAGVPWLWIPIDHCLVSSEVAVVSREVGPQVGSDHYPVLIELSLPIGR